MSEVDQRPQNTGHGWVRPRPDGVKARCGGPAMCSECRAESELYAGTEPVRPVTSNEWLLELLKGAASKYNQRGDLVREGLPALLMMAHTALSSPDETTLPRLEYAEHCECCQRNKITVDVFGRSSVETEAKYDATDIRYFLGWLSVELPELQRIETPRLSDAWEKWCSLWNGAPASAEQPQQYLCGKHGYFYFKECPDCKAEKASAPPQTPVCIWRSGCKHPEVCNASSRCVPGIEGQS